MIEWQMCQHDACNGSEHLQERGAGAGDAGGPGAGGQGRRGSAPSVSHRVACGRGISYHACQHQILCRLHADDSTVLWEQIA